MVIAISSPKFSVDNRHVHLFSALTVNLKFSQGFAEISKMHSISVKSEGIEYYRLGDYTISTYDRPGLSLTPHNKCMAINNVASSFFHFPSLKIASYHRWLLIDQ